MKVKFKGILDMEFTKEESSLATEFYSKAVELEKESAIPSGIPLTNEEYVKLINKHKLDMEGKDKIIADLKNANNQISTNNETLKETIQGLKAKNNDIKLLEAYDTIKAKNDEIASLKARIRDLETKPGEYSTGMAAALYDKGLISEEEHQELVDRASMGRDVHTYWDEFETYVDNYVESPMLVTDFGKFNVVNCTPHPVTITGIAGGQEVIGPSDIITRLEFDHKPVSLDGSDLPLVVEAKGTLINVPMRKKNTLYIVSRIVFDVANDREDFICPNVMRAQRNNGVVVSVPSFICRKELIKKAEEKGEI